METEKYGVRGTEPRSLEDLLRHWNMQEPRALARFRPGREDLGTLQCAVDLDGKPLNWGSPPVRARVLVDPTGLHDGRWYTFSFDLAPSGEVEDGWALRARVDLPEIPHAERFVLDNLYRHHGQTPADAEQLARALEQLSIHLYTETERFLYELLQNADDAPNAKGVVGVRVVLLKEHLLLLHDGQFFGLENASSVSRIGGSTKTADQQTIGYKGIGFKAVFRQAKRVFIHSGRCSFRFDHEHLEYLNPDRTPWQIKPIWTDRSDYPAEIQLFEKFFQSPVAIALAVGAERIADYRRQLTGLFADSRLILFLRHVDSVAVEGLNTTLWIKRSFQDDAAVPNGRTCTLTRNGESKVTRWRLQHFVVPVSKSLREEFSGPARHNYPDKLRALTHTQLAFAARFENGAVVPVSGNAQLFNYLPTRETSFGLPFLVNADFMTSANREGILAGNPWNAFLFRAIGLHFFEWLSFIGRNSIFGRHVVVLIPERLAGRNDLEASFNEGFDEGVASYAFVPAVKPGQVLEVRRALFDLTGLAVTLGLDRLAVFLQRDEGLQLADLNVQRWDRLVVLGAAQFTFSDLRRYLTSAEYRDWATPARCGKLLAQLRQTSGPQVSKLKDVSFLLDEGGQWREPQSLFFQPSAAERSESPFSEICYLHPETEAALTDSDRRWLSEALLLKAYDSFEVLQHVLQVPRPAPSRLHSLALVRLIFKHHDRLSPRDLGGIDLLLFTTQGTFEPVGRCYPAEAYGPQLSLEPLGRLISGIPFISPEYMPQDADRAAWLRFFQRLRGGSEDLNQAVRQYVLPAVRDQLLTGRGELLALACFLRPHLSRIDASLRSQLSTFPLVVSDGTHRTATSCRVGPPYIAVPEGLATVLGAASSPNLVAADYGEVAGPASDWLVFFHLLGVPEIQPRELLLIRANECRRNREALSAEQVLGYGRALFAERMRITREDMVGLRDFPLVTTDGDIRPASECYLADAYCPTHCLEALLPEAPWAYVSVNYLDNTPLAAEWRSFLVDLGAKERLQSEVFDGKIQPQPYLHFAGCPTDQEIKVENVVRLPGFKSAANNHAALRGLWPIIGEIFEQERLLAKATVVEGTRRRQVGSAFYYVATEFETIPCVDGRCYKPSEAYDNSLAGLVGNDAPVASVEIPPPLRKEIGLRDRLSFSDCLRLIGLVASSASVPREQERLKRLYEELGRYLERDLGAEQSQELARQRAKLLVPALDGQLRSLDSLSVIAPDAGLPPAPRSTVLDPTPFGDIESAALARCLGIPLIGRGDWQAVLEPQRPYTPDEQLRTRLRERAQLLGVYLCGQRDAVFEEALGERIAELRAFQIERISYTCARAQIDEEMHFHLDSETRAAYYTARWSHRRNARLGDFLLEALGLIGRPIEGDRLLDILDDDEEGLRRYLVGQRLDLSGCDAPVFVDGAAVEVRASMPGADSSETQEPGRPEIINPVGRNPQNWREFGHQRALELYAWLGYGQSRFVGDDGCGFDFTFEGLGVQREDGLHSRVEVEVKARGGANVEVSRVQWDYLLAAAHQDQAELLLVIHDGERATRLIRIRRPGETLPSLLFGKAGRALDQPVTGPEGLEDLLSVKRPERGERNALVLNWERLFVSGGHPNVRVYKPAPEGGFIPLEESTSAR